MLIGARLLQFAGALVPLGSSLFYAYGLRPGASASPAINDQPWLRLILILSSIAAIAGTVLWVMAETVLFRDNPSDGTNIGAVWLVLSETRFGRVCLGRIGLLLLSLAACFLIRRTTTLWKVQASLASLIIATFAWTGHGAMGSGWPGAIHLGGDMLHLWVAGVWFGALVPLGILILGALRSQRSDDARAACYGLDRFSAIGTVVVATLVVSGLINSWFLIGASNWRSLFTTDYGEALLVKLALFVLMLVLAAANRFRLAPRLRNALEADRKDHSTSASLRALKTSVLIESAMAVLVLLAVSVLGTLAPPVSAK